MNYSRIFDCGVQSKATLGGGQWFRFCFKPASGMLEGRLSVRQIGQMKYLKVLDGLVMNSLTNASNTQRMNINDFGDPLTFHQAPPVDCKVDVFIVNRMDSSILNFASP